MNEHEHSRIKKRSFNNRQEKEAERAREFLCHVEFPSEQEHKEIASAEF